MLDWRTPTVFSDWFNLEEAVVTTVNMQMHPEIGVVNDAIGSYGERGFYRVLETDLVEQHAPALMDAYDEAKHFVESMFDLELVASPYRRSKINIKIYDGEGSGQGLHKDSQPITVLLCLSAGQPLQVIMDEGTIAVDLKPCDLLVFCGRDLPHRVPEGDSNTFRVTVPMNFYFADDMDRPEWLDAAIYDNVPAPQYA